MEPLAFDECKNLKCIIAPESLHEMLRENNPNVEVVATEPIHYLSELKETGHAIVSEDGELLLVAATGKLVINEADNVRTVNDSAFQYGTITSIEGPEHLRQTISNDITFESISDKNVHIEQQEQKDNSDFFLNE